MTTTKPVKKSLSFSADEQDQQLLSHVNEALDNDQFASFSELVKMALQQLFTGGNAQISATDDASEPSSAEDSLDDARLDTVEESLQELIAAQNALTTALAAQQTAAADQRELTATKEAEHFAAIEATLGTMQTAQQELQQAMQQQGETFVTELQKLHLASTADQSAAADPATMKNDMQHSTESLAHLSRFLEDF